MIEELLSKEEGKTLEFKVNLSSPAKIIKTVIAFANTAGGTIVIGVEDKTKAVLGVKNILLEEERVTSLLYDSISPTLLPDIDIVNYKNKELLLIHVPHLTAPFYLKKIGLEHGAFVRLGSSNRVADSETLSSLLRLSRHESFDELVCHGAEIKDLDNDLIKEKLEQSFGKVSQKHYESLGLVKYSHKKYRPTYAGVLLFGVDKTKYLPDAIIKCVAFASCEKKNIIDKREIKANLIDSIEKAMIFIRRNIRVSAEIGEIKRIETPEYPLEALREVLINAVAHADYALKGVSVQISIYNDRMEFISPGGLPFGQTIESALSGVSKMRNPTIGRIFRQIGVIETLGIGLQRIVGAYNNFSAKPPIFEELGHCFKVTLFARPSLYLKGEQWVEVMQEVLLARKQVSSSEMAEIWQISNRAARARLNKMLEAGLISRNAKSKNDPRATYSRR